MLISACRNSSNTYACCSSLIPIPVSATEITNSVSDLLIRREISPFSVNFAALPRRLMMICRNFGLSIMIWSSSPSNSTINLLLFLTIKTCTVSVISTISSLNAAGSILNSMRPASILARSRILFIITNNVFAAFCTRLKSVTISAFPSASISSVMISV